MAVLTVVDRFWAKVDRRGPDECWPWLGSTARGYGRFHVGNEGGRHRTTPAHRFAYEQMVGLVPDGMVSDHLCRNRSCCNPAHLEPVPNRENVLRGLRLRPSRYRDCQVCGHAEDGGQCQKKCCRGPRGDRSREFRARKYSPTCTCGHVLSSHRQDPDDPWATERCKTCGCAGFLNREERQQQWYDDD